MKNLFIFFLLICLIPLTASGQEEESTFGMEKIRVQGYLIIEGHHETIKTGSDIPRKFLFIPLEKFKDGDFYEIYQRECQPVHNDLFIPTSFMEKFKMVGLNTFLRRSLNSPLQLKWENAVNEHFEGYLRQQSVFFKMKGLKSSTLSKFKYPNKVLNITFIDGVWVKFSVPSKYFYTSYIEGYNMTRLKKFDNSTEFYEYYYLLETKSFSPVVFINDDSLVEIDQ